MRSVLLAYMTVYLANPDGTMALLPEKEAEVWVHFFVGSAYFFPIIGGLLSDAFFGKYRIIISLSMTYCLGHLCLACHGDNGKHPRMAICRLALNRDRFWRNQTLRVGARR